MKIKQRDGAAKDDGGGEGRTARSAVRRDGGGKK